MLLSCGYFGVIAHTNILCRGVAQFGRARGLGPRCRRFKSCRPDHFYCFFIIGGINYGKSKNEYF